MNRRTAIFLLMFSLPTFANTPFSNDCTPAELKTVEAAEIVAQLVRGSMVSKDCAALKGAGDREVLVVAMVGNSATGYDSYVAFFDRKTFAPTAKLEAKSAILGFDLFPILFNQKNRLIFVHPASDASRAVLYLNVQASPATTRFSRWEYMFEPKTFTEGQKIWMIDAGILPKIYEDGPSTRALLGTRSVEI